ncbi:MAG: A/G-specific adenine glycosylase [Candidatus Korobacteraceae bacterium]|jgi:A/G-specific adenine glycosylase
MDQRLTPAAVRKLRHALLTWYDEHRRELPWRRDADPYRVWVSEIMLQQTRVAAVVDHYARFLQKFPTVQTLAAAREASVLAVWSGLGYYHRARRMHQAAKLIARQRRGIFPRTAEEWRELPGIGRYTSAAIASIAFGEAVAVVDGNVARVLERMFGAAEGREAAWQRVAALLDRERPGDFNEAMMELGATVCTPRAPQCPMCPLHDWCMSRGANPAPPQPTRKRKQLIYGLARRNGSVLLVQRPADASLMAGMWELPALSDAPHNGGEPMAKLRHAITDTDYEVSVFTVASAMFHASAANARWFARRQWERLPLTGLARKILRRLPG